MLLVLKAVVENLDPGDTNVYDDLVEVRAVVGNPDCYWGWSPANFQLFPRESGPLHDVGTWGYLLGFLHRKSKRETSGTHGWPDAGDRRVTQGRERPRRHRRSHGPRTYRHNSPRRGSRVRLVPTFKLGTHMRKTLALVLLALAACAAAANAQGFPRNNGEALAGVAEFDAQFMVATWLANSRSEEVFEENGQGAFVLALRRDGVRVDTGAPNYLFCEIYAAENTVVGGGSAGWTYVWQVRYFEFSGLGLHTLLWETGGIATRGMVSFLASEVAQQCADAFVSEWLRWNPR